MFADRPGRRSDHAEAVDQADRPDRARVGAAVLRLPAELGRLDHARQPADAGLGRRHDQRVQPARQHGRPVRRHRADRRRGAADRSAAGRDRRAPLPTSRYLALLLGATGGFLVYNVNPASIFMGDSGSLLLGFSFAAVTLSSAHQARGPLRRAVDRRGAGAGAADSDLRHDAGDAVADRCRAARAAQGGRDHSSHRLVAIGLSERRAVAVLWLLAAIGGAIGVARRLLQPELVGAGGARSFLVGDGAVRRLPGRHPRLRRGRRARPRAPRSRRSSSTSCTSGASPRCCSTSAWSRSCYYAAYRLRFEDPEDFMKNFANFSRSLPVVLAAQMVAFFAVGVYRGVWRHFGMMDTRRRGEGRVRRHRDRAARHPLRLPVLQLLADGVRDLRACCC